VELCHSKYEKTFLLQNEKEKKKAERKKTKSKERKEWKVGKKKKKGTFRGVYRPEEIFLAGRQIKIPPPAASFR